MKSADRSGQLRLISTFFDPRNLLHYIAVELAHELAAYLSKRYPRCFTVSRESSGAIRSVTIGPAGATYELPPPLLQKGSLELRAVSEKEAEEAMKIAALLYVSRPDVR